MRKAVFAGAFYPAQPSLLKAQLKEFFSDTKPAACRAVISPHAGYVYSGKTCAHAIAALKKSNTYVIIGPNHQGIGPDFSTCSDAWETPLGKVEADEDLIKKLLGLKFLKDEKSAHANEHSIEVQLPFLKYRFENFRIVPISIINIDYSDELLEQCIELGRMLARYDVGLIASSDFSHYLPIDIATEKDNKTIEKIKGLDAKGLFDVLEEIDASVCGYAGIAVVIAFAKRLGLKAKILHSSTSGDVTGDMGSVVSYWAIGFG